MIRWIALIMALGSAPAAACTPDTLDLRGDGASYRFTVKLADTNETRARGLMFVETMPRFEGMLFVYETPQRATFWMRNTLIPLDMIFIDPTGVVRNIHDNAVPLSEEIIDGGTGIQYVLEINGGLSERLRLKQGMEVRHPSIDQDRAVWPCADN